MGALHDGHLSLIRKSKAGNDITVCSIYVNPTQFNDRKDLEKYPRPIEKDIELLVSEQCDILFLPSTEEIYPQGIINLKSYDLGPLENFLEGTSRPGHFQGVANVVDRLLQIIQPDELFLGQKDFQQVKVIEKMIEAEAKAGDYLSHIKIMMCEIVREDGGLAMSSRNSRLSASQRKNARGISRELFFIREHGRKYEFEHLKSLAISRINSIPEARVDYLEFCDALHFHVIHSRKESDTIVCVIAVIIGGVRLLDNIIVP